MSRGPWKPKQPNAPPVRQSGPMREIADLFLELSALEQKKAQTHGHLSAWFRTIGVAAGEIAPGEQGSAPLLEQERDSAA